jgi:galactose oxidase
VLTSIVVKYATFEPQDAQFVRLLVRQSTNNAKWTAIADISVFTAIKDPNPVPVSEGGRWDITLDFPLVPVGVFVNPISGNLIGFSAYAHNGFQKHNQNKTTYTATWDRKGKTITDKQVEDDVRHDMFCSGTSFDDKGRMIITGGDTSEETSIYDSATEKWSRGPELNINRGYQGQTFVPNGKTFLIGGSWSGEEVAGNRHGEIFDPAGNSGSGKWKTETGWPGAGVSMTTGPEGESSRYDYHVWLFGWKNNFVFQAGPSQTMHWIDTSGKGKITEAGPRTGGGVAHGDSVCAITSMYDAIEGLILVAGGAPQYEIWNTHEGAKTTKRGKEAKNDALILTVRDPGTEVTVERVESMKFKRAFANGVTLPTGETFVVGGQTEGQPFYEDTWHDIPEIFIPKKGTQAAKWKPVARHSTPRVYHSTALLLPDATVLVGGGGLGRTTAVHHFDAQIYLPPYLFTTEGKDATRPILDSVTPNKVKVDSEIVLATNVAIDDVSLVRYSAATHSLNNDQRRFNLKPDLVSGGGGGTGGFKYKVKLPNAPGVALPGYWMVFAMVNGVPSVSQYVQIQI